MKKLIFGVLVLALSAISWSSVGAASVQSPVISSYDIQMTLSRDGESRSTLRTVETITEQFPETDQSHGLERIFVKAYDGHDTSFQLSSVTDENGAALPYHWSGDALRVGDANTFVHGTRTYVITFTQRDVTRYYADKGRDEFYWDVIGTEWSLMIEHASIKLSVDPSLLGAFTGDTGCYTGLSGSAATCELAKSGSLFSTEATNLLAGQAVTVALGFQAGTFTGYKASLLEQLVGIWVIVQVVTIVLGAALAGWVVYRWNSLTSRRKEIGTIVPEYLPPKDTSVGTAALIGGYKTSVTTAQMLDLAVRHYIKIHEVKAKTWFGPAEYEIEIAQDIGDLKKEEKEVLKDMYGGDESVTVGLRLNLKTLKNNTAYYSRTFNNDEQLQKLVRGEYGLKEEDSTVKKWLRRVAKIAVILAMLLLSPVFLLVALLAFVLSFTSYRLTDSGLALKRYLEGLKMYIQVAEVDRIKMLQSPEGAEKVAEVARGTDGAQLIKLYERVLPYAVLFGQEKQWNQQMGKYYEMNNMQPDWYVGQGVFNAVVFSTAMSNFSSSSNSASSFSSSSGGSGGGGFAGGGGGGGGGGSW